MKISKIMEVAGKVIFHMDLRSSAVKLIIDFMYLKPLEIELFEDVVLLLDAVNKKNTNFLNQLQQSVLKKLNPGNSLRIWKLFNQTEFLEVRFCIYFLYKFMFFDH